MNESRKVTYGLVLDLLSLAALESDAMTLVLKTLGGDEPLDLGGLGVRRLALALGLDLATDDVLADLLFPENITLVFQSMLRLKSFAHPIPD